MFDYPLSHQFRRAGTVIDSSYTLSFTEITHGLPSLLGRVNMLYNLLDGINNEAINYGI
jgi:hypothetical protein